MPQPPSKTVELPSSSAAAVGISDWLDVRRAFQGSLMEGRLLVWFSCGAASACALKLVAHLKPHALYCDTSKDEHPDNERFRKEVEAWTGIPVEVIKSYLYKSTDEVFEKTKYMAGIGGARCTTELKKIPRMAYQWPEDTHVFGYTTDERQRLKDFEDTNIDLNLAWPLIQAGMSKADCLKMITEAGIEIPTMYRLGFKNNNCIGCVKATSAAYWNLTRKNFPERYRQRAEQSRRLGVRLVRYKGERIFLDELPEEAVEQITEDLSCGPQCGAARTSNDRDQRPGDQKI
jgi:hypothetical protein